MKPLVLALFLLIQTICAQVCCAKQWKSQEMCEKWDNTTGFNYNLPPGVLSAVGGVNTRPREYPHMAALGYGNEKTSWSCGGSLISEKFILTAAHCLSSRDLGEPKIVRLGDLNLNTTTDDARPEDYKIKRAIPHPDYKPRSKYNDIALLELEKEVELSRYIKPACLQVDHRISGENWTATGWGLLGFYGPPAPHLQEISLREFPGEECGLFFDNSTRGLKSGVTDGQICAGEDGVDTCQGDSGGPLQFKKKFGLHSIIGVTSFGKACGLTKAPGVYTRVSKYIDWIESIVWP